MAVSALTYAASGVNIDAGMNFADMIRDRITRTWPNIDCPIGGFSGRVPLSRMTTEISGCCDGSGTVAILAALTERFSVAGKNAAAMSLVDAYVSGAQPVGLLDVLDVGRLQPEKHIEIIDGLIAACESAGNCRLIGGETAELPDMFAHDWMINVNTSVIALPEKDILTGDVKPGQTVWAWRSEGPASNGFSLIRKIFDLKQCYTHFDRLLMALGRARLPSRALKRLDRYIPDCKESLADSLLKPVPVWINQIESQRYQGVQFAAHAHITGGGLVDNIPRVLPKECKVVLDRSRWHRPPIFSVIEREGRVSSEEMDRTFNQGIMVVSILDGKGHEPNSPNIVSVGQVERRDNDESQVQFIGSFS